MSDGNTQAPSGKIPDQICPQVDNAGQGVSEADEPESDPADDVTEPARAARTEQVVPEPSVPADEPEADLPEQDAGKTRFAWLPDFGRAVAVEVIGGLLVIAIVAVILLLI